MLQCRAFPPNFPVPGDRFNQRASLISKSLLRVWVQRQFVEP
jgi:hypothetical protein